MATEYVWDGTAWQAITGTPAIQYALPSSTSPAYSAGGSLADSSQTINAARTGKLWRSTYYVSISAPSVSAAITTSAYLTLSSAPTSCSLFAEGRAQAVGTANGLSTSATSTTTTTGLPVVSFGEILTVGATMTSTNVIAGVAASTAAGMVVVFQWLIYYSTAAAPTVTPGVLVANGSGALLGRTHTLELLTP